MTQVTPVRARIVRWLAAIAAVSLVLLGTVVAAPSAHAAGVVTGRLVDQLGEPVLGLQFYIHQNSDNSDHLVKSDSTTGAFTLSGLDDSSYHYLIIGDTTALNVNLFTDDNGDRYENNGSVAFFAGTDLGDIVMNKFVPISGTISNWTPDMGTVRVDIYGDVGGSWHQLGNGGNYGGTTTTANFSFDAPITAAHYTLRFQVLGSGPYLDAFLGGGYDNGDPTEGTELDGVPGVGFSGLTIAMPAAALITGRVTTSGSTPLQNITVWVESEPDGNQYDETLTDADGQYSVRVRPGETNSVHAQDDANHAYVAMTYDRRDGCGCDFDPVVSHLGAPAQDIDFDLLPSSTAPLILGLVTQHLNGSPLGGISVRLFRSTPTGWALSDSYESDTLGPPNFGFQLSALGTYRVQFVDTVGTILRVTDGFTAPGLGSPVPLDTVPACYADLGDVSDSVAVEAVVDVATTAGSCTALNAGSNSTSGGSGGTGGTPPTRHHSAFVAPQGVVFPTAAPSATPNPSASPSPTAEPTNAPSPIAKPAPSTVPDFWWLLWVVLGLVVLLLIAGAVVLIRRR